MTEDEFRSAVLAQFETIGGRFDAIDGRLDGIESRQKHADARLEALFARLNEQEILIEAVIEKLGRVRAEVSSLRSDVGALATANDDALGEIMSFRTRISRLENPDPGAHPDVA